MTDFYELPPIQFCSDILVVLNFIFKILLVCLVICYLLIISSFCSSYYYHYLYLNLVV